MGRTHLLIPGAHLNYASNLRNLWNLPLHRLAIYCQPFYCPAGTFKVSPQASCQGPNWIGLERYLSIIEETIPFRILNARETTSLLWRHVMGSIKPIDQNVCVLIDYLNTRPNYFHWFLDALPRILAAETYSRFTGESVKIVVPQLLASWQEDSLTFLKIPHEQLIRLPPCLENQGWSFENLITTFSHRHTRYSTTGHFDAMSPATIKELSRRLMNGGEKVAGQDNHSKRIYVSRGAAHLRQVTNEDEIMAYLSTHGFECVHLDSMPLGLQMQRFRAATHVISAHGGALTNLMYISPGCQVLEIFQEGHGVRPDFFQLAALRDGLYSFAVVPSLNAKNDIKISIPLLRGFLEASL